MKLIAPSLLSADFSNLQQQIRYLEIGGADLLHCDVMDGHFVTNLTFGPFIIDTINKITKIPLDVHLMISNPELYIDSYIKAGSDFLTVHQETVPHLHKIIKDIKSNGIKAGVSINPSTPFSFLEYIIEYVDLILIMSVNPGFGGQKFIQSSIRKINEAAEYRDKYKLNFVIEVDGGVNIDNIKEISEAGCDIFVAGSSIFSSDNIAAATAEFKNIIVNK